jgi:transposase
MIKCKKCNNNQTVKNGFVRGSQRYKCRNCKHNFVDGDKRTNHSTEVKKALAVILYSSSKASFNFLGKLFGVNKSSVYKWINNVSKHIPEPSVSSFIKEMEFDDNSRAIATHSIKK